MTFHDRFCGHADGGACICTQLLAARIDERERQLAGVIDRSFIGRDFAEAVAARLVGVVCEQERTLRTEEEVANGFLTERDAARAEVDEVRKALRAESRFCAEARAEVAALRALVAEGIEAFRLTKEYVNIPDEHGFVLLPDVEGWSHWDWVVKARAALLKREGDVKHPEPLCPSNRSYAEGCCRPSGRGVDRWLECCQGALPRPAGQGGAAVTDIEQAVYEALGAASTCWTDEGVFDSDRAKAIGEDLMYRIVQEVEQARAENDRLNIEIGKAVDSRERLRVEMGQKVIDAHREVALARADEREQRATAIEEFADDWSDWDAIVKAGDDMFALREVVKGAIHDAAAIARGEQP